MNISDKFDSSNYEQAVADLFRRAQLNYQNENYQAVIQDCTKLLQLNPNDNWKDMAYDLRGECYGKLENDLAAIEDFTQNIRYSPENIQAYIRRGYSYQQLKHYHEAIEDYTQALRRESKNSELAYCYHLRAQCHQALGNREEAIRDIKELIRIDPTYRHR